jgi:uncharacterized protein YlaI
MMVGFEYPECGRCHKTFMISDCELPTSLEIYTREQTGWCSYRTIKMVLCPECEKEVEKFLGIKLEEVKT